MLNNPLDSNLGYDQVYFVYDSFDTEFQSPKYNLVSKDQQVELFKSFNCNNDAHLVMYKAKNEHGFTKTELDIDCSSIGNYSMILRDETSYMTNQYKLLLSV